VLKFFSLTSGLKITETKSTFHKVGLLDWDLIPFKSFFPFRFMELEEGFKYLGFFIKAGAQH
jgi:hypothetical protein